MLSRSRASVKPRSALYARCMNAHSDSTIYRVYVDTQLYSEAMSQNAKLAILMGFFVTMKPWRAAAV